MIVALVKAYRFSLNELLDQYFVGRLRMHFWESNIPFINYSVELIKVAFFLQEHNLFIQNFLKGMFSDRNLKFLREERHKITQLEHEIDISD